MRRSISASSRFRSSINALSSARRSAGVPAACSSGELSGVVISFVEMNPAKVAKTPTPVIMTSMPTNGRGP